MDEPNTRKIVILGKTGSGKSSLANTMFGDNVFKVSDYPVSETKTCQSETKCVNGRSVQLIDTPGLFDTDPGSPELIIQCLIECAPGPHAFLLVLKVERFTKHEQDVVDIILKYFSEEALKYITVVCTHGDDLPEGMRIKEWVSQNEALKHLVQKCGGRCHVFDNKHWNNTQDQYRNNNVQVEELLNTIDTTVRENRGGYFTNELLMKVGDDLQREEDFVRKSKKKSEPKIQAKQNLFNKYLTKLAGVSTGILLGALLGVPVMIGAVIGNLTVPIDVVKAVAGTGVAKTAAVTAAGVATETAAGAAAGAAAGVATETAAGAAAGAAAGTAAGTAAGAAAGTAAGVVAAGVVVGGAVGGWLGYDAAEQAKTPGEAAEKAAKAVWNKAEELVLHFNKKKKEQK